MLIVVLAMLLEVMLNLVKMGASTALAARSGWSIWPGMPGQFAPEWGGQFDAESLVTFRRNWVVNISGISKLIQVPLFTSHSGGQMTTIQILHLNALI
jgi:hypothetical protein